MPKLSEGAEGFLRAAVNLGCILQSQRWLSVPRDPGVELKCGVFESFLRHELNINNTRLGSINAQRRLNKIITS